MAATEVTHGLYDRPEFINNHILRQADRTGFSYSWPAEAVDI